MDVEVGQEWVDIMDDIARVKVVAVQHVSNGAVYVTVRMGREEFTLGYEYLTAWYRKAD
jgi:hypothetical protein